MNEELNTDVCVRLYVWWLDGEEKNSISSVALTWKE